MATTTHDRLLTPPPPLRSTVPAVHVGTRRFRRQLPAYSPLPAGAVLGGVFSAVRARNDPRDELCDTLRRTYQSPSTVLTSSGTHALQLAIAVAGRLAGCAEPPTVALPAFTCFDVATAAVGAGARIALYDVDPDTLGPDPDSLEAALASGARVVVATPLYGFPMDWEAIEARAARWGAVVVEDAAQGQGAQWRGRPLGTLGAVSVLSFGRGKGWTGCGGGALLLRGDASRETPHVPVRSGTAGSELKVVLSAVGQWLLARPSCYAIPASIPFLALGQTRYHTPSVPRGMSRASAAVALRTRADAALEAAARRLRSEELLAALPETVTAVRVVPGADASFIRLPVRIPGGFAGLADAEQGVRLGIGRSYPSTLAELKPVRERMSEQAGPWPGSRTLVKELITLPTHSQLTPAERHSLIALLSR